MSKKCYVFDLFYLRESKINLKLGKDSSMSFPKNSTQHELRVFVNEGPLYEECCEKGMYKDDFDCVLNYLDYNCNDKEDILKEIKNKFSDYDIKILKFDRDVSFNDEYQTIKQLEA